MERILTDEQAAYLAGFIDGEGSLECQKQTSAHSITPRYVLRLAFVQATKEPLATFTSWFSCHVTVYPSIDPKRSPRHRMSIPKETAVQVIRECLPFLILKKREAEIILSIERVRSENTPDRHQFSRSGSSPMPANAVREMEALFLELRSLKSNKRAMHHRINR